ncbi:RNA-directed DNA polymerase from mobile element jockey [Trichonephila clavipes]|uniref:RNA-directed DNA polymerase from mobile element jockey n=1 Tax=Trichonephila clavipes TaxID=2585209 RepID=A0A8X6W7G8_TRICX|nr:RNA-directed DNA polymerase from mobile element jockey [Trichonephila clavipes]
MIYSNLRTKTTGEFLKLYTNNHEEYHSLQETIKQLHYQFYVIKPKNDRPIKVVIKGLPKSPHVDEIKSDFEEQGFEPERVVQLIGRKTKKPHPVYMISLPRNITNLKIFDLKTLGYLSIRVEPYEGRDLENLIQTSSDCIVIGDLNATHSAWNCTHNSTRGNKLLDFTNLLNLNIAYPNSPTRFGHGTANTIDIAIIRNFYYPFNIFTTLDLSSDHNPVYLNFKLKTPIYSKNPRDIYTCWSEYTNNLNKNLSLFDYHPNNIQNSTDIDNKIKNFPSTILATHSRTSRPIGNQHRSYTPPHIQHRNRLRKQYHRSPAHKTELNSLLKIRLNNTPSSRGIIAYLHTR